VKNVFLCGVGGETWILIGAIQYFGGARGEVKRNAIPPASKLPLASHGWINYPIKTEKQMPMNQGIDEGREQAVNEPS
jgi:hypothetical protein